MRKKLFILFILAFSANYLLANPTDSRKTIELKVKHKIERRSILASVPTAFITGTLLEINFDSSFRKATIKISNNYTGEEVYHEEAVHDENVIIDMLDFISTNTEYSLYINLDENTTINGFFIFE